MDIRTTISVGGAVNSTILMTFITSHVNVLHNQLETEAKKPYMYDHV